MRKLIIASLSLFCWTGVSIAQQNETCPEMEPICTQQGLNFQALDAGGNVLADEPGNDYDCLGFSPSPSWYYLEISQAGNIDMSLTAPQDIDFIIWGPFPDLATAQSQCGNLGNGGAGGLPIDCSYSSTNMETPSIPNAQVGEVYVMLITNYANSVQQLSLTQTGGTGATDCSIVQPDPCVADAGTFVYRKNGQFITGTEAVLCPGDDFLMTSNQDYTLPNDTIPNPPGDGVWNAEMMYLIYDQAPVSLDPATDPGFLGLQHIKVGDQYGETNGAGNYIFDNFGCGKYWIVPTPGDDGLTTGDINGAAHYDKNNNGCYDLDTAAAFKLTLTCPITATNALSCDGTLANNGITFTINGGLPAIEGGNYIITNNGDGILSSNSASVGGTVTVSGLTDGDQASITVTDANGCSETFDASFSAPSYTVSITPGSTCGTTATNNGAITVTGNGTVPGYTITFVTPSQAPSASPANLASLFAGDPVTFLVEDGNQCVTQGDTTIGSQNHFILTNVTAEVGESCPGECDGSATLTAVPVDGALNPDGAVITAITVDGNSVAITNPLNIDNLCAGVHYVQFEDDFGCDVTVPVDITSPGSINLGLTISEPICYGQSNGSIYINATGGTTPYTYFIASATDSVQINQAGSNAGELLSTGWYYTSLQDDNGCVQSDSVFLSQPDSMYFTLFLKETNCFGEATGFAFIDNIFNATGPTTISWQSNNPNPQNTNPVSNLFSGSHTVTVVDDIGCISQQEFQIADAPEFFLGNLSAEPSLCRGSSIFPGTGTVSGSANGGTGTPSYTWFSPYDTAFTATVGNRRPGWHVLVATDANGCIVTDSIYVDSLNPVAAFTATPLSGTAPVVVTITDQSQNRNNNAWNLGIGNPFTYSFGANVYDSLQPVFDTVYTVDGDYTICLFVENGRQCYDTLCQDIQIFPVPNITAPNVFTPNGDGSNDVFYFPGDGISELTATFLNRWGNKVYEFTSINDTWDGTNMNTGKKCADGVYSFIYKAKAQNGTEYEGQGFVHLISK